MGFARKDLLTQIHSNSYSLLHIKKELRFFNVTNSLILFGADERDRTADLLITNQLLYQLSHIGPGLGVYLQNASSVGRVNN